MWILLRQVVTAFGVIPCVRTRYTKTSVRPQPKKAISKIVVSWHPTDAVKKRELSEPGLPHLKHRGRPPLNINALRISRVPKCRGKRSSAEWLDTGSLALRAKKRGHAFDSYRRCGADKIGS